MEDISKNFYEDLGEFLRFSKNVKSYDWRRKIEKLILRLVERVEFGVSDEVGKIFAVLENIVDLALVVGYVDQENFNKIKEKLKSCQEALPMESFQRRLESSGYGFRIKSGMTENMDLNTRSKLQPVAEIINKKITNYQFPISNKTENSKNQTNDISERHSAILTSIRQFGNCRMKDLMTSFPQVSERTLRNDLQKLCEAGSIRRVGSGGPYTFYTCKM